MAEGSHLGPVEKLIRILMGSVRIQPMMDVRDGLTSQEMDIALQMLQTAEFGSAERAFHTDIKNGYLEISGEEVSS
jgi:hypothetical protein